VKRILFVCIENSNRSQMAEAFARIHGAGKVEAVSAGSHPSGKIDPRAVEVMREKGYDLLQHCSKSLDEIPPGEYEVAVTMGCGDACPMVQARRRLDWSLPDPRDMSLDEIRQVRDAIEGQVLALLRTLDEVSYNPAYRALLATPLQPGAGRRLCIPRG
jgi:protein-tyrosine-phosphatase